jgi:uncharacterized protein YigA (DUF484 family)
MTGQDRPQMLACADSDESVVRYLEENPEFLLHHPQLLRSLHVPHECGGDAVSLIEAQVRALRARNAQLHEHLTTLLDNARNNEELAARLHRMVLALIESPTLDEIFTTLYQGLEEGFGAHCVSLRIFADAADIRDNGLAELVADWPHRYLFKALIDGANPVCGPLDSQLARALFAERAQQVSSAAVLPLMVGEYRGVLGIGSRHATHFHAGMGTMYLRQLADVLARLLLPRVIRS